MFNTNTLGYKLVTDRLLNNRKHSEQLNKYVAGLFDADGCVSIERSNIKTLNLRFSIFAASTVDSDLEMLRALLRFYQMGRITYKFSATGIASGDWRMSTKESKKMYNLISTHLRVKGTHFRNMIEIQERYNGSKVSDEDWELAKEERELSRKTSRWLKHPKHLSYAWVAGYLDGDGCYGFRKKYNTLDIRVPSADFHILDKLVEDFGGRINIPKEGNYKVWSRGLGKGNIQFSLPFLKRMREYSCIQNKYNKIQEMINYLESTRVAETNQFLNES